MERATKIAFYPVISIYFNRNERAPFVQTILSSSKDAKMVKLPQDLEINLKINKEIKIDEKVRNTCAGGTDEKQKENANKCVLTDGFNKQHAKREGRTKEIHIEMKSINLLQRPSIHELKRQKIETNTRRKTTLHIAL